MPEQGWIATMCLSEFGKGSHSRSMFSGICGLMMAGIDIALFSSLACIAMSFFLLWQWEARRLSKKRDESRRKAYERLTSYCSRSDHPKYELSGKDATVVLRKEEFVPKDGRLVGTFVFLCRNAFGEYFFCVIDANLFTIHIPKERALLFLKDFPGEYAAEIDYLAAD